MANPVPITPQASDAIKATIINENFKQIQDQFTVNIIKDENGIPKLIFGRLPDGTYGLVIAKDGIDVLTLFS